jgi:hypothetical protein
MFGIFHISTNPRDYKIPGREFEAKKNLSLLHGMPGIQDEVLWGATAVPKMSRQGPELCLFRIFSA